MTPNGPDGDGLDARAALIRIPDFEISWAGGCPWNQGLCFGSEDGRLIIDDGQTRQGPFPIVDSHEAVNSVAFIGQEMAVSTRAEVAFWTVSPGGVRPERVIFDGGAHGIVATPSGRFVAPLGPGGLLLMEPQSGESQKVRTFKGIGKTFNFYRASSLGTIDRGDVIVSAMRRDGLAVSVLSDREGNGTTNALAFPGLDVADVCSLSSEALPFAAVALGIDRSLHLFRDALNDPRPATLRIEGLEGISYKVLSARGHIFLLTSRCFYVLIGLASKFLGGYPIDGPTPVRGLGIQAVDFNLAFNRWILIVMPDGVIPIDIERLSARDEGSLGVATSPNGAFGTHGASLIQPPWEIHSDELALAV